MNEESQITGFDTPSPRCPAWCRCDDRHDEITQRETVHPEDRTTWHHGAERTVQVIRTDTPQTELQIALEWWDPDRKRANDPGPEVTVKGDDGSSFMCSLSLPIDAAEQAALAMLELVREARA
jgi:uncharacterized protein DUF6907